MPQFNRYARLHPVPHKQVELHEGFWSDRARINREMTLPYQLQQMEETGRIDRFRIAAGRIKKDMTGIYFNDSDVYKWMEAAAYSLATHPDAQLDSKLDDVIELVAAAQQDDGYLNTHFRVIEPEKKWQNLRTYHELYCAGHLFEAAAAHFEATAKRSLLDVACKFADHIDNVFGYGKRAGVPGHEEIELALVKLYHVTGEQRYLKLAQFFIDTRGQQPNALVEEAKAAGQADFSPEYCQAHMPVREQSVVVGHAVRAMYLFCGMADLYNETGDNSLLKALVRLWHNLVYKRMYITGGIGSTARNEGFTNDYDLPNESAYAETCAAIGSVFWNHRMLMATGETRFADVMELALYNGVVSGVGLDGKTFFYENPLRSRGTHRRQPWFACACCPPNIARLLASISGYIYSTGKERLCVNLYAASSAKVEIAGQEVNVRQDTAYPWDGGVRITLDTAAPVEFTLCLRVPRWCKDASITVKGEPVRTTTNGDWLNVRRRWSAGDTVELSLAMPAVRMETSPHVEADYNRIALQRGPLVYCFEQADNGGELFQISLPSTARVKAELRKEMLGGAVVLEALGEAPDLSDWDEILYRPATQSGAVSRKFVAVPYCLWANRQAGEMAVWINGSL